MIMRTIIETLAVTFALVLIAGAVFVFAGLYDISATVPHWRITYQIIDTARVRSIKAHAAGIAVPPGLDDPGKILLGAEHFAAHCAVCRGAPGVPKGAAVPNVRRARGRHRRRGRVLAPGRPARRRLR